MQNNLLIIGNGFDVNLKYRTGFKYFIQFCLEKFDVFYDNILDKTPYFCSEYRRPKLNSYDEFKNYEEDYKDYVEMAKFFKSGNITYEMRSNQNKSCFNDLKKRINDSYLMKYYDLVDKNINDNRWADVENNLLDICRGYLGNCSINEKYYFEKYKEARGYNGYVSKEEFAWNFKNDIDDFKELFSRYIRNIIQSPHMQSSQEILKKYHSDLSKIKTKVLNFNYTDFNRILNGIENDNIYNIHGSAKNSDIVLGIDPTDVSLPKEFDAIKKPIENVDKTIEFLNDFDKNNGNIVILGHSLDSVDRYVLNGVFKDFGGKVIVAYHDRGKEENDNKMQKSDKETKIERISHLYGGNGEVVYYNIVKEWDKIIDEIDGNVFWCSK